MKCPTCHDGKLMMKKYRPIKRSYHNVHGSRKAKALMICNKCSHEEVFL